MSDQAQLLLEFASANIIIVAALAVPLGRFLFAGWFEKRQELLDRLNDAAIRRYYRTFRAGLAGRLGRDLPLRDRFMADYNHRFGRGYFVAPVIFLMFTTIFFSLICTKKVFFNEGILSKYSQEPWVAVFSISGAFMWITNDIVSRVRQNDLVTSDINRAAIRLVIAAPIAYAFASILQPPVAEAMGLFLGAFPTDTVFKIIRRQANQRLNMGDDLTLTTATKNQLERLYGINTIVAERFADEGISTIGQLAYCDPLILTMRTAMTFSFITDCVSQSLAWIYLLEDGMVIARKHGLRGAQEIACLINDLASEGRNVRQQAKKLLDNFSSDIKLDPSEVVLLFRQIAEDPHTEFLMDVWTDT